MTTKSPKPPLYPKTHLLAASGVAAMLSLSLLVFPSSEVEAKKTAINLELGSETNPLLQEQDDLQPAAVTSEAPASPFAQTQPADTASNNTAAAPAAPSEDPRHKSITVKNGDTLSTVFAKAGLTAAASRTGIRPDASTPSGRSSCRFGRNHGPSQATQAACYRGSAIGFDR